MSAVQVVVADDDVLLREGLASLLERSGFEVVGQAADAAELLALVRDRKPQLVVVDIRMPPTHATEGPRRSARDPSGTTVCELLVVDDMGAS